MQLCWSQRREPHQEPVGRRSSALPEHRRECVALRGGQPVLRDRPGWLRLLRCAASDHRDDDRLLAHHVDRVLEDVVAGLVRGFAPALLTSRRTPASHSRSPRAAYAPRPPAAPHRFASCTPVLPSGGFDYLHAPGHLKVDADEQPDRPFGGARRPRVFAVWSGCRSLRARTSVRR
jgi:hypothetical protein